MVTGERQLTIGATASVWSSASQFRFRCLCFFGVCHGYKSCSPSPHLSMLDLLKSNLFVHLLPQATTVFPRRSSLSVHLPSMLLPPRLSSFPFLPSIVLWDTDERIFSARVVPSVLGPLFLAFFLQEQFLVAVFSNAVAVFRMSKLKTCSPRKE